MLSCLAPYFLILTFEKKGLVCKFLYKMLIDLKHHVKSEID